MTNRMPVNYPPKVGPDKFVVRAKSNDNRVIRFPSIKATTDYKKARQTALRVAKRPDVHNVQILRIPAAR